MERKSDCNCHTSSFADPFHKHIITGNLCFIRSRKLRQLLMKGPNFREAVRIDWKKVREVVKEGILECQKFWADLEKVNFEVLNHWSNSVLEALELKIQKLERVPKFNRFLGTKILDQPDVRQELKRLQEDFVFVPTDKASNNISIICKKFYVRMLLK